MGSPAITRAKDGAVVLQEEEEKDQSGVFLWGPALLTSSSETSCRDHLLPRGPDVYSYTCQTHHQYLHPLNGHLGPALCHPLKTYLQTNLLDSGPEQISND